MFINNVSKRPEELLLLMTHLSFSNLDFSTWESVLARFQGPRERSVVQRTAQIS